MESPDRKLKYNKETQDFIKLLYEHDIEPDELGQIKDPTITILDESDIAFTDFEKKEIKVLEERWLDDLYAILGSPWRESIAKYMTAFAIAQITLMRIVGSPKFRLKNSKGLVIVDVGKQKEENSIEWELI